MRPVWVLVLLASGCETIFPLEVDRTRPRGCSPASMIVDGFPGLSGSLGPPWRYRSTDPASSYALADDRLVITTVNNNVDHAATLPFLEMRGQRFAVTARNRTGGQSGNYGLSLRTQEEVGNTLFIGVQWTLDTDGNHVERLIAGHTDNVDGIPMTATLVDIPRINVDHDHWGIEQDGSITRWLVSADGVTFTKLFETDGLVDWVTFMEPALVVNAIGGHAVEFDDYGGAMAVPSGKACPVASLFETFDQPVSADWRVNQEGCTVTFDGDLVAELMDFTGEHNCSIQTSTLYDLKQLSLTLEVGEIVQANPSTFAGFEVETLAGSIGLFRSDGTTVTATSGGMNRGFETAANARFWRFRATADDDLIFEVSADGETFEQIGNSGAGTIGRLDAVRIGIVLSSSAAGQGSARFGGLTSP